MASVLCPSFLPLTHDHEKIQKLETRGVWYLFVFYRSFSFLDVLVVGR
jgi:hypothetical protein